MSYVYIQSEKGGESWQDGLGRWQVTKPLYTVGHYAPEGWVPESDHVTSEAAAARVHYLNGGTA